MRTSKQCRLFANFVVVASLLLGSPCVTLCEPRVAGFDELVVYPPGTMDRDISGIELLMDSENG